MIRNIIFLTRNPQLHKEWINIVVEYIREHYGDPPQVDAIVGPDTKAFVFAVIVASKLDLPYIPMIEVGEVSADRDDVIKYTYTNRNDKVLV